MKILAAWFGLLCGVGCFGLQSARAADVYYHLPTAALTLTDGAWPGESGDAGLREWRTAWALQSYAVLDGPGEAYFDGETAFPWAGEPAEPVSLAICAPAGQDVTGRLFVRRDDLMGLVPLRFKVPATAARPEARERFLAAKQAHFRALQRRGLPGTAWFRHQADSAARERGADPATDADTPWFPGQARASELEDTYDLFTGGRALSENLQLERALPPSAAGRNSSRWIRSRASPCARWIGSRCSTRPLRPSTRWPGPFLRISTRSSFPASRP
ncbi:MAG: hypothetical protein M5U12_01285 [Verrucomicrobia bacterium]|nr:hypothetical protein [Verrucomicrobiota bacterium]